MISCLVKTVWKTNCSNTPKPQKSVDVCNLGIFYAILNFHAILLAYTARLAAHTSGHPYMPICIFTCCLTLVSILQRQQNYRAATKDADRSDHNTAGNLYLTCNGILGKLGKSCRFETRVSFSLSSGPDIYMQ